MLRLRTMCILAVLGLGWGNLFAQTSRGTVTGIISDATGAAIPNAQVELRNQLTNTLRSTTTSEAGVYRFDAVDTANHTVTVKANGFATLVKRDVAVVAGQTSSLDLRLEVGQAATTVEVTAEAASALQVDSPVRGGSIATEQSTELPVVGRNPVLLALTMPGVSTNRFGFGVGTFSVNGSRGRANNFMLDGTDNNDSGIAGQSLQIRNPDAVAEVSVQTSNVDAEFGRAGGAVVNAITKSGTNAFHGTAFYLLDVTNDDAITNTQSLSAAVQQRGKPLPGTEQWFGGTFGGPIVKNKTFFFGAYHQQRRKSSGLRNLTAPTANGWVTLNSLFPAGRNSQADLYRQLTAGVTGSARPFPVVMGNNRPTVEFGNALVPIPLTFDDAQFLTRVDHQFSERDQLSVRYARVEAVNNTGGTGTGVFPGYETPSVAPVHNLAVSETHVFSPSFTNELRLSYARISFDFPNSASASGAQTTASYGIAGGLTALGVPIGIPQGRIQNNYTLQNTMSYTRGRHAFRFGLDLVEQRGRDIAPYRDRPQFTYQTSTGFSGFANFIDDFGGANGSVLFDFGSAVNYPKVLRQAYFFQDRWRPTNNLTLTLGVRYDYFGQPINALRTAAFSGLFNVNPQTLQGPYIEPSKVDLDKNNWAPVVGIAYSPDFKNGWMGWLFGDKKSVIRTGYQLSYDTFFNNILSNAATSAPNLVSTATNSIVTTALPRGLANLTAQVPRVARAVIPSDGQTLVSKNLVSPYTQRWTFGLQRELRGGFVMDLSYVGTKGTKLFINEDMNPLVPAYLQRTYQNVQPGYVLEQRLDTLQGGRLTRTNGGDSNYHGFQSSVNRRFRNGLLVSGSYTWSKNIDNASEVFGVAGNNQPQQAAFPSILGGQGAERAVSLFDRTHRAVFSYVYELPWMKQQRGFFGRLVGGWQISGVTTFESGAPLTVTNGVNADGIGGNLDRPDYNPAGRRNVRAVPVVTGGVVTGYINPDANNAPINPAEAMFIGLPTYTGNSPLRTGNLGRNTLRTPGIANFDVNFQKSVRLTERFSVQFRAETFNFFNHPQFSVGGQSPFAPAIGNLPANVTNSQAGQFLDPKVTDGGGRVIRYQLKLIF